MNCLKLNNNQTDQERWFNLLSNSINGNYLSSIPYLDIYRSKGWDVISYLYEENQKDVAGVHFLTRSYLKKTFKIASINSGFIFLGEPAKVLFDKLLTHFLEWAESRNAVFLRINPRVPQLINGNEIPYSKMIHNLLVSNGFRPLKNEDYTYWIDLHLSEDELLKRMKKQTRYEVRKGLKSKIEVERYDSFNQEIFLKFWELYSTLGKMKEFSTMSRQEFYLLIKSLLDFELASLFVLIYEQKIINISLCAKVNIGAYMYGAMDPGFKLINDCPSPGPMAQWEMITYLKSRGIRYYDLGFCPGPVPYKNHSQYNIWNFKYGFGGEHVQFMPTYVKKLKPIRGMLIETLMRAR